jgi:hypothetical protein
MDHSAHENTTIIKGYGPTDGIIKDTTSYRTEVCGKIAVLTIYGMIQSMYNWNAATIEHVCDSESALNRIWNKSKDGVFNQSRPDADSIPAVRVLLSSTKPTHISPKSVCGHADKRGPPYTLQEEINMQTDRLAGKAHANLPPEYKSRRDCLHFPEQNISIVLDGKKVTSRITRHVARSIHHPSLEHYLCEKEEWNDCTWNEIAWPLFKIAFNKIPSVRQPTTKMLYIFWCTNSRDFHDRAQLKLCYFCES